MNDRIASAVFDSRDQAQAALTDLRSAGFTDSAISVVGAGDEGSSTTGSLDGSTALGDDSINRDAGTNSDEAKGDVVKGAAIGAGTGALLGIAALAIPGVGPFVAAGAIAASAIPAAAAIGGGAGLAAGSVAGLLSDHGVDGEDSSYYEERLNQGGIFVSVQADASGAGSIEEARDILMRNGGHSANSARSETMA
ncbi:MAG: hypothetical protein ABIW03_06935 [Sphingomicrobium sp.]